MVESGKGSDMESGNDSAAKSETSSYVESGNDSDRIVLT
jgi:hypothetical protein